MKLWIMSDLHLECEDWVPPPERPDHDMVIIAGDLRPDMAKGVAWIAAHGLNEKPVVYIGGNHEFYGCYRDRGLLQAREAADQHCNIHVLQDEVLCLRHIDTGGAAPDSVRILAATLWTDYALHGEPFASIAMLAANEAMNDHRKIRLAAAGYRRWLPKDAKAEHLATRRWIERQLWEPFGGRTVVVTHHAPSARSRSRLMSGDDPLNAAYASRLDDLVAKSQYWVHGHTHAAEDYFIGDCRVVANPRGYPHEPSRQSFNPAFVLDTRRHAEDLIVNEIAPDLLSVELDNNF